jgi:hypothetical protein
MRGEKFVSSSSLLYVDNTLEKFWGSLSNGEWSSSSGFLILR